MAPHLLVPGPRHLVPLADARPGRRRAAHRRRADAVPRDQAVARTCSSPDRSTLVIGAGGLGHMAIQILAAITATRIIAVDQSPDALQPREEVGAAPRRARGRGRQGRDPGHHEGQGHRPRARLRRRRRHDAARRRVARALSDVVARRDRDGELPVQLLHRAVRGVAADDLLGLGQRAAWRSIALGRGRPRSAPTSSGTRSTTRRRRTRTWPPAPSTAAPSSSRSSGILSARRLRSAAGQLRR